MQHNSEFPLAYDVHRGVRLYWTYCDCANPGLADDFSHVNNYTWPQSWRIWWHTIFIQLINQSQSTIYVCMCAFHIHIHPINQSHIQSIPIHHIMKVCVHSTYSIHIHPINQNHTFNQPQSTIYVCVPGARLFAFLLISLVTRSCANAG
jgi:hypothetical protein